MEEGDTEGVREGVKEAVELAVAVSVAVGEGVPLPVGVLLQVLDAAVAAEIDTTLITPLAPDAVAVQDPANATAPLLELTKEDPPPPAPP